MVMARAGFGSLGLFADCVLKTDQRRSNSGRHRQASTHCRRSRRSGTDIHWRYREIAADTRLGSDFGTPRFSNFGSILSRFIRTGQPSDVHV